MNTTTDTLLPQIASDAPKTESGQMFRSVRKLMKACGGNKTDKLIVAITAFIEHGVDTGKRLVGAATTVDFDENHVGLTLGQRTGRDPARHDWYKDEAGRYRTHHAAPLQAQAPSDKLDPVPNLFV